MSKHQRSWTVWLCLTVIFSPFVSFQSAVGQTAAGPEPGAIPRQLDPVAAELALNEGILAVDEGRYADALNALRNANPTDTNVILYRGRSLLGLKRAREAAIEFQSIQKAADAPPELGLDLGIALIGADDSNAAIPVLKQHLASYPDDVTATAMLNAAIRQSSANPGGTGQSVPGASSVTQSGNSAAGFRGAGGMGSTSSQMPVVFDSWYDYLDYNVPQDRRWNLTMLYATEYDSNIVLAPNFGGLGSGITKSDTRSVLAMFGDYRLVQEDNWNLGVTGSANNTFQYNLDQYNLENYSGGGYSNYSVDNWILGTNYQFQETTLDNKQFAMDHRMTLSATMLEGKVGHVTGYYEFENIDLNAPALIAAQNRSGNLNSLGITQALYLLGGQGRLFGGYRYANTDAKGSDFDLKSQMVTARVELPLTDVKVPWLQNAVFDAEVRHFWDDYRHGNSLDFFNRARSDRRVEVRTGLQKYLSRHLSARLDYTFVNNDSNVKNLFDVEFYSYSRHIVSSQLIFDF